MRQKQKLSSQIARPTIIMLILIPLIVMLIFNVVARAYFNQSGSEELSQIVEEFKQNDLDDQQTTQEQNTTTLKDIGDENPAGKGVTIQMGLSDDRIKALQLIFSASQISRYTIHTKAVIVNEEGQILYPISLDENFLTIDLIEKSANQNLNSITAFRYDGGGYLVYPEVIELDNQTVLMLFIASSATVDQLIQIANSIFLLVFLTATIIATLLMQRLARRISSPLSSVAHATTKIGNGEYTKVAISSDNAEITELIEGVNEMSSKLAAMDEAQKTFLQDASHELRTPLMSIQGYAEGIENGYFDKPKETAKSIKDLSIRLNTLVDELITLSRIKAGNYQTTLAPSNINTHLNDYIQQAKGLSNLHQIKIDTHISDEPIICKIDEPMLYKAIYNILTNAIKYAQKSVDISLLTQDNYAWLIIKDDGLGISETDLPHIFDRFYKGALGNLGLGLAIAKSAIEMMDGTIEVYNQDGAVFAISLPIYQDKE